MIIKNIEVTIRQILVVVFGIILIGITSIMILDHVTNYETWGNNEEYFIKDYHGYEVTCDVNYFSNPTNCKVIDKNGKQVTNETIILAWNECYMFEDGNLLPCRMD